MSIKTLVQSLSSLRHSSALGIGVDIVHVPRITSTLSRFGKRYLDRAFHGKEQAALLERLRKVHAPPSICDFLATTTTTSRERSPSASASPPQLSEQERAWLSTTRGGRAVMSFLASRWAAKEALHKALRTERLLFTEICVANEETYGGGESGEGPPPTIDAAAAAAAPFLRVIADGTNTNVGGAATSGLEAAGTAETRESLRRSIRAPSFVFSGEAQKTLSARGLLSPKAPPSILLSLSHDGDYAIAFVTLNLDLTANAK